MKRITYGIGALQLFTKSIYDSIIKYLGPHGPDGLLTLVVFAGVMTAVLRGVDPWFAGLFGIALLGLFFLRRTATERHEERKADQDVLKLQLELERYRIGQRTKLEKEKLKRIPASVPSNRVRR